MEERVDYRGVIASRMRLLYDAAARQIGVTGETEWEAVGRQLKIDPRQLQRYCTGRTVPRLGEAAKIAWENGKTLDWLVGRDMSAEQEVAAVTAVAERRIEDIEGLLRALLEELEAARQRASDPPGVPGVPVPTEMPPHDMPVVLAPPRAAKRGRRPNT